MKKFLGFIFGVILLFSSITTVFANEKFDIIPDLPEALSAAQASSVTITETQLPVASSQMVGHEPNFVSVIFSLLFVILLIYATGIIYSRLNKFGINTMKKQIGEANSSRVTVVSTTPLGSNKTLHVVELDGKRMLIGASSNSIDLIKDLGTYPPVEINQEAYSKIEIPNIRIPKIEIPKIEFPNIGFTKVEKHDVPENTEKSEKQNDNFEISEIYEETNPDIIIDNLFNQKTSNIDTNNNDNTDTITNKIESHVVDPDEYALYKKYL